MLKRFKISKEDIELVITALILFIIFGGLGALMWAVSYYTGWDGEIFN